MHVPCLIHVRLHLQTDTCRILEWLKEIQRSLGSVELTSLMQAAAINHAGIFKVGRYALGPDSQHGTQVIICKIYWCLLKL